MADPEYKPEIIDKPPAPDRFDETPRWHNFIGDWWREATGQTSDWHQDLSPGRAILRKIMLWSPAVVLVALLGGGVGAFFFTGWRAEDLARKTLQSLDRGEVRLALIQAESARNLRSKSPAVLRALAKARFAANDPASLQIWGEVAKLGPLSQEDRQAKAEAAVRFGDGEEFEEAIAEFVATGRSALADSWRGRRALFQRDFSAAERHLRAAAQENPSPQAVLELADLLVTINTKESLAEATALVDRMAEGPDAGKALSFALSRLPAGRATRHAWATKAMGDASADNEALLPAATVLINDRLRSVEEVTAELDPIFVDAPLERRGLYARWLLERKRPGDALSFIYPGEARGSRGAFLIRAEALSAVEDWEGLNDLIDAGSPVNEPVTYLLKGRADANLGRAAAAAHFERAIRASASRMILPEVLAEVDSANRQNLADQVLLELCGEPASADYALRVARWRFSQRGEPRLREEAFRRALSAAPRAATVRDLARQQKLLGRERVDPAETGEALQKEPANIDFRLTHAFALFIDGRPAEARRVLEPVEAIRHQLQPAQKAVVVAVLAATGSRGEAVELARTMKSSHLTDAEYRLVFEQTLAAAPDAIGDPRERAAEE